MTEREELEQYERMLAGWRPGPPKPDQHSATRGWTCNDAPAAASHSPSAQEGPHSPGAILLIQGHSLVIYKQAMADKGYHLVYLLAPAGKVKLQGVALDNVPLEELGCLGEAQFEQLQRLQQWSRDVLVFHFYRYEDVDRIPASLGQGASLPPVHPSPAQDSSAPAHSRQGGNGYHAPAAPPPPPEPPAGPAPLRRGQRLRIQMGPKSWDAVYWGHDDEGHVVAHLTYNTWSLMHLDLERFGSSMSVDPHPDPALTAKIEAGLSAAR